jgi:nucleoside 2-deoxyribosyltransferase
MKIYLAGPMRGYPNFNFPAFDFAAAKLREDGHEVFSPAERDRTIHGKELEANPTGDEKLAVEAVGFSLRQALAADTHWIANHATAIALLAGWEKSSGVAAELALAKALGHTVIILGKDYAHD